jgi:hypothetical protein
MVKKNNILLIIFLCILIFCFSYYKTLNTDTNTTTFATISKKEGFSNCSKCLN